MAAEQDMLRRGDASSSLKAAKISPRTFIDIKRDVTKFQGYKSISVASRGGQSAEAARRRTETHHKANIVLESLTFNKKGENTIICSILMFHIV
jgi:hypothetical protein